MKNSEIFTIENGCQVWDLSVADAAQFVFFDALLDAAAAESVHADLRDERDGKALISDYINPPLSYGFARY